MKQEEEENVMRKIVALISGLVVCGIVGNALAADPAVPGEKTTAAKVYRASKIEGLHVRNSAGEKLGSVNDLVVDMHTGKIVYVAMSFGGVLGIGEKLFAVPLDQMKFEHGKDDSFFVLNVPKERLKDAPGFDKNNWPNFADPHWSEQIDKYYRTTETRTGTTTPNNR
jgi:sporulation protein YlmC with PRC-barrel domain